MQNQAVVEAEEVNVAFVLASNNGRTKPRIRYQATFTAVFKIVGRGAFFVTCMILSHADRRQDFSFISLISAYIHNVTEWI